MVDLRYVEDARTINCTNLFFQESIDNSINLKDETPETIERVLSFLYLRTYDDGQTTEPGLAVEHDAIKAGMINILVFNAADKFGIKGLKEMAFQNFTQWASPSWNLDYFPEVIEEALKLELIPPHEEKIIARTISRHPSLEKLLENPTINTILNSSASLATLVIKDLAQSRRLRGLMDRDSLSDDRLQLEVAVANLLY